MTNLKLSLSSLTLLLLLACGQTPETPTSQGLNQKTKTELASQTEAPKAQIAQITNLVEGQYQGNHGIAIHGTLKYPQDFGHYDYVNPQAPKGGELRLAGVGLFDTLNPFTLRGKPASLLDRLCYSNLMTSSRDEAFSEYGLVAQSIEVAQDKLSVSFVIDSNAKFANGQRITPEDIGFSFDILVEKGEPFYKFYYIDVKEYAIDSENNSITFFFNKVNNELPTILGQLPVLSKAAWEGKDFQETTLELPVCSGPYSVESAEKGRIIYKRIENYWAQDYGVNKGRYNFEKIIYTYFLSEDVMLEAFKSNQDIDLRIENSAKRWRSDLPASPHALSGKMQLVEIPNQRPAGMQALVMNLREAKFQDIRLRKALTKLFDFDFINKTLMYSSYTRTTSYYQNSRYQADSLPSQAELALLEPFRADLPRQVFDEVFSLPSYEDEAIKKSNYAEGLKLFEQAGWTYNSAEQKLQNENGETLSITILLGQKTTERIVLPFVQALQQFGIDASISLVEANQYFERIKTYDYEMTMHVMGQSLSPGNEQYDYWHSSAAVKEGSRNVMGINQAAVDALVEKIASAQNLEELTTATKSLDRVLIWQYFGIPLFHSKTDRLAYYQDKVVFPDIFPSIALDIFAAWSPEAK